MFVNILIFLIVNILINSNSMFVAT